MSVAVLVLLAVIAAGGLALTARGLWAAACVGVAVLLRG
jgi:hypothetical protein